MYQLVATLAPVRTTLLVQVLVAKKRARESSCSQNGLVQPIMPKHPQFVVTITARRRLYARAPCVAATDLANSASTKKQSILRIGQSSHLHHIYNASILYPRVEGVRFNEIVKGWFSWFLFVLCLTPKKMAQLSGQNISLYGKISSPKCFPRFSNEAKEAQICGCWPNTR